MTEAPAPEAVAVSKEATTTHKGLPGVVWGMIAASLVFALLAGIAAYARSKKVDLPVLGEVPAFAMRDQAGAPVSPDDLRGQPYIADFIFTSCTASCPKLTARMKQLHEKIVAKQSTVRLVSISVDPETDTPAELARYATRYGADPKVWRFLTGSIEQLEPVVVKGFKIQYEKVKPISPNANLVTIMHGDWFVLVDGKGRIRGYYDTNDSGKLDAVLEHAQILARYPDR